MKISVVKRKTPSVKKFEEIEWPIVDKEHYGRVDVDFTPHYFYLKAEENKQILGIIQGRIQAGVCTIHDIIIGHNNRGEGIGKKLMARTEQFASNNYCHKISLVTGSDWPAIRFYEKLGYKKAGERLNDMLHVNFIEYTKFIN